MSVLHVHRLGRISYAAALERQLQLVEEVRSAEADKVGRDSAPTWHGRPAHVMEPAQMPDKITGETPMPRNGEDAPGHLLLLEHDPPVITLGRRGKEDDILLPRERIAAMGIEVHESTRGGEVTYHGPGQLVAYAIHKLHLPKLGVRDHVRGLEETILRLLARYGLEGQRKDPKAGLTGVWVGDEKVAAIGVAVHRWITYHGLALNVCTDLSRFKLIVPCGLTDAGVTSLTRLLGRDIAVEEIQPAFIECFAEVFGYGRVETAD